MVIDLCDKHWVGPGQALENLIDFQICTYHLTKAWITMEWMCVYVF